MNLFQTFNNAFSVATLGALVAGIFRDTTPLSERPLALWLFVSFFVLLRTKIFMDDQKYFGAANTKNTHFKVGFLVGLFSWLLWIVAGYGIKDLRDAYFITGVAIGISTLWIVVVAFRSGAYREQYIWIATNAIFCLLLWAVYRRNMPSGDLVTWVLLGGAVLLTLIDLAFSKSVPELRD